MHTYLGFDHGVVGVSVEHDDGVGEHVGRVGAGELLGVAAAEALRKLFHDAVDLLSLPRETEAQEDLPNGLVERQILHKKDTGKKKENTAQGSQGMLDRSLEGLVGLSSREEVRRQEARGRQSTGTVGIP